MNRIDEIKKELEGLGAVSDFAKQLAGPLRAELAALENAPKRPREVWVTYRNGSVFNAFGDQETALSIGASATRFIEDTPREVTDAITERQLEYALNFHSVDNAMATADYELANQLFDRAKQFKEEQTP